MPVNVIGTLKPKNNGKFPVAEAADIKITDNLRLDKALENLNNFVTPQMYGAIADGINDDTSAIQQAINALGTGSKSVLYFPAGTYTINDRVIIDNKTNITIICAGTIIPISGAVPSAKTIHLRNSINVHIDGLTMDGNLDGITIHSGIGTEVLFEMQNCKNITFVNTKITNAHQTGISGANITNLKFINSYFENIGEHVFYFDSNALENVDINGLYVKNIGTNPDSSQRETAVFKCRYHNTSEQLARNISISNFTFIDEDQVEHYQKYKVMIQPFDTFNFTLKNGYIEGLSCELYTTNVSLEHAEIDGIHFTGRCTTTGIGLSTAGNTPETIENPNSYKIIIKNSDLHIPNDDYGFLCASYYNCNIDGYYLTSVYMKAEVEKCILDNCVISLGTGKIEVRKCSKIIIQNSEIKVSGRSNPIFIFYKNCKVIFDKVKVVQSEPDTYYMRPFFNANEKTVDFICESSELNGSFLEANSIKLSNSDYNSNIYIDHQKLEASNVSRNGTPVGTCIKQSETLYEGFTVANCDLRFNTARTIKNKDLLIIPSDGNMNFSYTLSNNIITITRGYSEGTVTYSVLCLN